MTPDNIPPSSSEPSSTKAPLRTARFNPWLWLAIAALALVAWQWLETRQQLAAMNEQVARRLAEADTTSKEDRGALKQLREQLEGMQGKLGAADARLADFSAQAESLQALYQGLTRSRDDSALLEAEQAITLAGQQLQLAGNVPAAILGLRAAEARLAGSDLPQTLPLRKALANDLERLKALPTVDLPGTSLRIEQVLVAIDKLPLAMDGRPQVVPEQAAAVAPAPWWQRGFGEVWRELRGLVRIQRFDREEVVLLAPGQGFLLRENLKLRLLNARLALLSRDQATFRSELKATAEGLSRHFDGRDKNVQAAQETLRSLLAAEVVVAVPSLNETQTALGSLRSGKGRK